MPPRNGNQRKREKENNKVSGSVYRLWSLGLVDLQSVHCRSHLALLPHGTVVIEHGGATGLSPQSLHCGLCSQTGSGQAMPGPRSPAASLHRQVTCQRRVGAAEGGLESQPHPDKQIGLKGARLFVRTQSLLDKEKTSWQSHLNDVDRWHPIVVVLRELTAQQPPCWVFRSAAL